MNDREPGDPLPDITRMVHATGEARLHSPSDTRDRETLVAQLPPCRLVPLPPCDPTRATIAGFAFEMRIPDLAAASPTEVPDNRWVGWDWSPNEFILLHVDPNLEYAVVTYPSPKSCRLDVAGRLMEARRIAPGDAGWAANAYAAEVTGFLDDATLFWAQVVSPTEMRRESLLAGLATLARVLEWRR